MEIVVGIVIGAVLVGGLALWVLSKALVRPMR